MWKWGILITRLKSYSRERRQIITNLTLPQHYKYWHDFAANKLFGIEVNERISRIAKMNMIIHDDGHTNVVCHDSLDHMENLSELNRDFLEGRFDLVMTNPPFGAEVKLKEKAYLKNYSLGKALNGGIKETQKSEILFIERCWQFLKPETGMLAIILPDGILTNHTHKTGKGIYCREV